MFISKHLETCEKRDPKGVYAKARRGEITNMTGNQDPYEEPNSPQILVDTDTAPPEENSEALIRMLGKKLGKD